MTVGDSVTFDAIAFRARSLAFLGALLVITLAQQGQADAAWHTGGSDAIVTSGVSAHRGSIILADACMLISTEI